MDRVMTDNRAPGLLTKREEDALAYVDKGLDNIEELDPDLVWTNAEVIELLEDIRSILLTGEVTPGTLVPGSGELESADAPGGDS